jgi:hypothetical protein
MKSRLGLGWLLLAIFSGGAGAALFNDLPADHPAYKSVYNLTAVYRIVSSKEKYFHGQDDIDRTQFLALLKKTTWYLNKITGQKVKMAVPTGQAYLPSREFVQQMNRTLRQYKRAEQYDFGQYFGRGTGTISRYEAAIAADMLVQKVLPDLPAGVFILRP